MGPSDRGATGATLAAFFPVHFSPQIVLGETMPNWNEFVPFAVVLAATYFAVVGMAVCL